MGRPFQNLGGEPIHADTPILPRKGARKEGSDDCPSRGPDEDVAWRQLLINPQPYRAAGGIGTPSRLKMLTAPAVPVKLLERVSHHFRRLGSAAEKIIK